MPQVDWASVFQLSLLICALPAQYFLTNFYSTTEHQSQKAILDLVDKANSFLSWESWEKWCIDLVNRFSKNEWNYWRHHRAADIHGESPPLEVLKREKPNGYFAGSTLIRSPRAPNVSYRLGQVIEHSEFGYRGVIVGWDERCKAPSKWISKNHYDYELNKVNLKLKNEPHYLVLVDSRDRAGHQIAYIPQSVIKILQNSRVLHNDVEDHFDLYDGSQYIPRSALKQLYPDD